MSGIPPRKRLKVAAQILLWGTLIAFIALFLYISSGGRYVNTSVMVMFCGLLPIGIVGLILFLFGLMTEREEKAER